MTEQFVVNLGRNTLVVVLMVSGPMLLTGLAVGLIVSILQSITQVQEMTLSFVPKIIAVMVVFVLFLPWTIKQMVGFFSQLLAALPGLG